MDFLLSIVLTGFTAGVLTLAGLFTAYEIAAIVANLRK